MNTILSRIGNTPLVELQAGMWVKMEQVNPSGSLKARLAKFLVEKAEAEGLLKPGGTIVEATSGNTGNALSMVAAVKGYKMVVVMPSAFSQERVAISRAFGAEMRLIDGFDVHHARTLALELAAKHGWYCPQQFDNDWNIECAMNTAAEIVSQLPKGVVLDAVVQGVGTGGTLIGMAKYLRAHHNPNIKIFAMEPSEAATIKCGEFSEHLIEGISDGFIPSIFERNRALVDGVITIKGAAAVAKMKGLAKTYGTFVGPSSGANWLAAQQIRQENPAIKNVLTFFCDAGEKYLLQHYL